MVSKVLKHYVDILEDFGFVHVHKSYLVNISALDHFIKKDGGYLVLKDGTEVPVSYRKKDKVLKIFDQISL
jgi:two-component system LytT family response regulator